MHECAWRAGGQAAGPHTAAAACQLSQPLLTWQHNKNCHVLACRSCCELIDTHALSMHRVVARCRCLYRLIRKSLIFARFSAMGMRVGLYAGRLIHEYIRYVLHYITSVILTRLFTSQHLKAGRIRQIESNVHGRGRNQITHRRHYEQKPLRHRHGNGVAAVRRTSTPEKVDSKAQELTNEHAACLLNSCRY